MAQVCARGIDDLVADAYCGASPPSPRSLVELLATLGMDPSDQGPTRGFAITAHSTATGKRIVSAINPRVVFAHLPDPMAEQDFVSAAFVRGEPFVEVITQNRVTEELQFYAFAFALPCQSASGGCSPGNLLTEASERGWESVDIYHEEDLKNTTVDCRICHQPNGPGTAKFLRMQELERPWTHWFSGQTTGGRALLEDYFAARGNETYAGIPGHLINRARPNHLDALVSYLERRSA